MMLDLLAASAKKRVEAAKSMIPLEEIKKKAIAVPKEGFPFEGAVRQPGLSFICEIKKASPSKGTIAEEFPYLSIAKEYEEAGAECISVLTEPEFFKGSDRCLREIRKAVSIPLLRKDFTVDEYQIYEAKAMGADAVLLICALLTEDEMRRFLEICEKLGISAQTEAHTQREIETALKAGARLIGINNRDLHTFEVKLETYAMLRPYVPKDILLVAESGIQTAADVSVLRRAGADAVLIGEALMRRPDKKAALSRLKGG